MHSCFCKVVYFALEMRRLNVAYKPSIRQGTAPGSIGGTKPWQQIIIIALLQCQIGMGGGTLVLFACESFNSYV